MPSQLHEALLQLFRNRPELAPELLRESLHVALPPYTEVRVDSADLTDIQPAEYRADLVILLLHGRPVLGIVVEVQLGTDEDKRYVWPVYVLNLRARIRCPVCLLVVAPDESVARWAAKPIELGGGNRFNAWVLDTSGVPAVIDVVEARADPELAVLSAMAHGRDPDAGKAARIALAAQTAAVGLDAERARLYFDLVMHSLSEAARRAFETMDPAKYEYQSEFAKQYYGQGRAEGIAEGKAEGLAEGLAEGAAAGRADVVLRLLALRFGTLADAVRNRVRNAAAGELDGIAERLLSAGSLEEALGGR